MNKAALRKGFNALVALIPKKILSGFLRSFEQRPELAEVAGYNVFPRVFYSPFPLAEEMDWNQLTARRTLPAIDFQEHAALTLLRQIEKYGAELAALPYEKPNDEAQYWFNCGFFTDFDAAALHGLLRFYRPKRYIELGCGFSSFISSSALARNIAEGSPCAATYADPEPRRDLAKLLATGQFICERVQRLPLALFQQLEAGDILFIDTSHVMKLQSDVVWLLLEVIPILKPGVIIHIHDIFSPYDYPLDWVQNKVRLSCNEQYGVECLLAGGDLCRVLLPLHLLWREQRPALEKLFPRGKIRPHSFWLVKN